MAPFQFLKEVNHNINNWLQGICPMNNMNTNNPKWSDWLKMTEEERKKCIYSWNVYNEEGKDVVEMVIEKFQEEYGNIPHLRILGKGILHGGVWVINVQFPFIFDKRKIPNSFLGIDINISITNDSLPDEFKVNDPRKEYIWAPDRYEKYVDKNIEIIRQELGNSNMDKTDILSALCGQDFNDYVRMCEEWERKGIIPSSQDK
jgi:hypothetical protein